MSFKTTTYYNLSEHHPITGEFTIPKDKFYGISSDGRDLPYNYKNPINEITFNFKLDKACGYEVLAEEGTGKDRHKIFGFSTRMRFFNLLSCDSIRLSYVMNDDPSMDFYDLFGYYHQDGKRYIPRNANGKAIDVNLGRKLKFGEMYRCTISILNDELVTMSVYSYDGNGNVIFIQTKTVNWNRPIKTGLWHYMYFEEETLPAKHYMQYYYIKILSITERI